MKMCTIADKKTDWKDVELLRKAVSQTKLLKDTLSDLASSSDEIAAAEFTNKVDYMIEPLLFWLMRKEKTMSVKVWK